MIGCVCGGLGEILIGSLLFSTAMGIAFRKWVIKTIKRVFRRKQ